MATQRDTKATIIEAALVVLKELGSEGLTVRKVAVHAGVSLGNLQYHFKDKTALLDGMSRFYFDACVTMLDNYTHKQGTVNTHKQGTVKAEEGTVNTHKEGTVKAEEGTVNTHKEGTVNTQKQGTVNTHEQVRDLILFFLDHVDHISDMCRLFREIWALATRDDGIHTRLMNYYKMMAEKLSRQLRPFSDDPQTRAKVVGLLLPYFEGYSINGNALALDKRQVADMLTDLSIELLS